MPRTTIIVTGAAGFIGAAVARALLARSEIVIGIDNFKDYYPVSLKEALLAAIKAEAARNPNARFTMLHTDFSDHAALDAALDATVFDRIVHLGAQAGVRYPIDNPRAYIHSNVAGHLNLLEFERQRGVAHLVYASSSSIYGGDPTLPFTVDDRADRPLSLYAASKRADELLSET